MSSNFRILYRSSGEYKRITIAALFVLCGGSLIASFFLSFAHTIALVFLVLSLIASFLHPSWMMAGLFVYLPFHAFILKWIPQEFAGWGRYFVVLFIVFILLAMVWKQVSGQRAELVLSKKWFHCVVMALLTVVGLQLVLGYAQILIGTPLNDMLLPVVDVSTEYDARSFWDPDTRVFGTFGHFDQYAFFLVYFVLFGLAWLHEKGARRGDGKYLWIMLIATLPLLWFTYSVSAWVATLAGFFCITLLSHHGWLKREKQELRLLAIGTVSLFVASFTGILFGFDFGQGVIVLYLVLFIMMTTSQFMFEE